MYIIKQARLSHYHSFHFVGLILRYRLQGPRPDTGQLDRDAERSDSPTRPRNNLCRPFAKQRSSEAAYLANRSEKRRRNQAPRELQTDVARPGSQEVEAGVR